MIQLMTVKARRRKWNVLEVPVDVPAALAPMQKDSALTVNGTHDLHIVFFCFDSNLEKNNMLKLALNLNVHSTVSPSTIMS